jgi:septal ring factor EnvC (AmiA/AmiB activator)
MDEVALLSQRLDSASKEVQRLASDNSSQATQISKMKASIETLQHDLDQSRNDAAALSSKVQQLQAAASAAEASAAAQTQQLGGRINELLQQVHAIAAIACCHRPILITLAAGEHKAASWCCGKESSRTAAGQHEQRGPSVKNSCGSATVSEQGAGRQRETAAAA